MKNLRSTRSLIASLAAAPIMMAAAWPAMAQTYPTRPIVIVVPFAAGGNDILARLIAQHMSRTLGQPFVIAWLSNSIGLRYPIVECPAFRIVEALDVVE